MIREVRPDDLPAITRLRTSVAENHLSTEQMAERGITTESVAADILPGELGAWLWEENGEILSFAMADRRDASALFTKPGFEARGFGTKLLVEAEAWLAMRGHSTFRLATGRATRAAEFYRRKGWQFVGNNPHDPADVIFRKPGGV